MFMKNNDGENLKSIWGHSMGLDGCIRFIYIWRIISTRWLCLIRAWKAISHVTSLSSGEILKI